MNSQNDKPDDSMRVDAGRRRLLEVVGAGAVTSAISSVLAAQSSGVAKQTDRPLRWGIVGTGGIANHMASMIKLAAGAELAAVASRKLDTAKQFANKHGIAGAFGSWAEMLSSNTVDAVYVATPTSVREEVCLSAAANGKHVLGEKPFANLPSLRRITAACRKNGVGFMDGTHFVHHPRTQKIKTSMLEKIGSPWTIDSAFQFGLTDADNIRLDPALEPYGAIGDAGWYNMRAAVEYTAPGVKVVGVDAYVRRHKKSKAVITGSGVIAFSDGSTNTWNCGFESGALNMDLRLSGAGGQFSLDDFVFRPGDGPAEYVYRKGGLGNGGTSERIAVPSAKPPAALMFENFAAMVGNSDRFEASVAASEKTQEWLDAIWNKAIQNERS
ncbi:MAG: Gfo/Idh/MocA family oxidoreductase [Steroidobacteraceae bacterium]|nr:Gfo/Idh/MocA family oxidoreductase [Steroidobacteraceae bacterium]